MRDHLHLALHFVALAAMLALVVITAWAQVPVDTVWAK